MTFPKSLLNKIKRAPVKPGCYIFRDAKGKVLYIGKAVNIRNRVKSYFTNYDRLDPKMKIAIDQIAKVEFIVTDSNLEALILETNLIKKYKPKYNRMMKDDKNYAWLMVTRGEDFPRIEFIRNQKIKSADYFGPYVSLVPVRRSLKELRKIFPYRSCKRKMYFYKDKKGNKKFYSSNKKMCLYFHLKLCDAPCTGKVAKSKYRKNVNSIKLFFRSKKFKITEELNKEMKQLAQNKKFEKAAETRDKLEDLSLITQRIQIEKDMDEVIWKKKKEQTQLTALKNLINRLKIKDLGFKKGFRIECYDISNISGKSATGSMVVFINGKSDKSQYRKFKIKLKQEPDDFLMLKEVFSRRFKRQVKSQRSPACRQAWKVKSRDQSFSDKPHLIIVDGGKGQLSSVLKILKELNLDIPTVGLAKKDEEIFKWQKGEFKKIKLRNGSYELFLIQKIRDEAHRFAIKYHRILRSKKQIKSVLDDIPGVGDIVRKRLLKAFGSAENIKRANNEQLQTVVKNKRTVESIKKLL